MTSPICGLKELIFLVSILMLRSASSRATEWKIVPLPGRALDIAENNGSIWVCGADELITVSADGGKTWTTKHSLKNGRLLLSLGFADRTFGYAAGTGGAILITKDGGDTWNPLSVPSQTVYQASFSDEKHGIIQTPGAIYTTVDGGANWNAVQIDLSSQKLKGFNYVLTVLAADANHLAIVLSEGGSSANAYRLLLT